jgi:hypothetical protein
MCAGVMNGHPKMISACWKLLSQDHEIILISFKKMYIKKQ